MSTPDAETLRRASMDLVPTACALAGPTVPFTARTTARSNSAPIRSNFGLKKGGPGLYPACCCARLGVFGGTRGRPTTGNVWGWRDNPAWWSPGIVQRSVVDRVKIGLPPASRPDHPLGQDVCGRRHTQTDSPAGGRCAAPISGACKPFCVGRCPGLSIDTSARALISAFSGSKMGTISRRHRRLAAESFPGRGHDAPHPQMCGQT